MRWIQLLTVPIFIYLSVNINAEESARYFWNKDRGYQPFLNATSDGLIIDNQTDSLLYDYFTLSNIKSMTLSFRSCNIHGNPHKKYPYYTKDGRKLYASNPRWGFFITFMTDTIAFTLKGEEKITAIEPVPSHSISLHHLSDMTNETLNLTEGTNPYNGDNLWEVSVEDEKLVLKGGDHNMPILMETSCPEEITGFGFYAGWADKLKITDISLEVVAKESYSTTDFNKEKLDEYFKKSKDDTEGYYIIFDRDLEESLLKLGGNYILGCVKEGEEYSMIYIEGASVNQESWKSGDLKAILKSTPFEGLYDVEWIDSMKQPMKKEVRAQKGEGGTLLFQFPYQSSKLRLRKIPQ